MDGHDLLEAMRGMTQFESVGDAPQHENPRRSKEFNLSDCITHVSAGNRKMPVLKAMNTTACERNCFYCPFRAGRSSMRRVTFSPDDMAHGFMALYRAGAVEGIFLSSGVIRGGVSSQDPILDTGAILREQYGFRGYIHLKIMPGAEADQVQRAMQLADRVSSNLEAPNAPRLEKIAPGKQFENELLRPLKWVEQFRQSSEGRLRASSTTELVVGPAGENDLEILNTTDYLYRELRLARVYYSAFHPVSETPLDNYPATDDIRRIRLYQASFLLRDYGFDLEELPFIDNGNLPKDTDPKRAWADASLIHAPLELNTAAQRELMRVPGIGAKGAARIIAARRKAKLRSLDDLRAAGVVNARRAAPYVLMDGQRPVEQPRLF
ncbi:MAG: helix-hairpin-helix domain-containing protein [Chloroflexi bacterium]|nr:helix-hairpin-helix domain-containing protein [Chloroflexota bacterium]